MLDNKKINFYFNLKIVKLILEKYIAVLKISKYRILKKNKKLNDKRKILKRTKPSKQ